MPAAAENNKRPMSPFAFAMSSPPVSIVSSVPGNRLFRQHIAARIEQAVAPRHADKRLLRAVDVQHAGQAHVLATVFEIIAVIFGRETVKQTQRGLHRGGFPRFVRAVDQVEVSIATGAKIIGLVGEMAEKVEGQVA